MKRIILFFAMAAVMTAVALAQAPKPIEWYMTARMTSETEGVMTITAEVADGWHLYSTNLPENAGSKATSIEISHPKSLTWTSGLRPSATVVEKEDPLFGVTLSWWDTTVTFTRTFTTSSPEAPGKIEVKVTFMGCNDQTCLPPSTVNLSRVIKPKK
ncbi:MAG: protein-disulfide reductase DsbD N-terminal domain-containing protein [Lachnoclostridium sp.]|nr:protein-disulfide reductase DsbD N-terminal domain-containing protein [Lachnoclostridium sp.]